MLNNSYPLVTANKIHIPWTMTLRAWTMILPPPSSRACNIGDITVVNIMHQRSIGWILHSSPKLRKCNTSQLLPCLRRQPLKTSKTEILQISNFGFFFIYLISGPVRATTLVASGQQNSPASFAQRNMNLTSISVIASDILGHGFATIARAK